MAKAWRGKKDSLGLKVALRPLQNTAFSVQGQDRQQQYLPFKSFRLLTEPDLVRYFQAYSVYQSNSSGNFQSAREVKTHRYNSSVFSSVPQNTVYDAYCFTLCCREKKPGKLPEKKR